MIVRTIKPHVYAGIRRRVGVEYSPRGRTDEKILRALGLVADLLPAVPVTRRVRAAAPALVIESAPVLVAPEPAIVDPQPAEVTPPQAPIETAEQTPDEPEPIKPKRAYKRRDMVAE